MAVTKIIFLVLPKVHLLDLAGVDQVFYEARDHGAEIEVEYCTISDTVETSTHIPFGRLTHFSNITVAPGDFIFIPGAETKYLLSKEFEKETDLFEWVRNIHAGGAYLCSICTGAFFLAMTGLLDGRKCTTHWRLTRQLKNKYPAIHLAENILFTEDERIFTSAGVTAGIDMALYILSKLKDDNFSFRIARELVVYIRRRGSEPQQSVFMSYRNHIHAGIHSVQDYLQENMHKKNSLSILADIACMSPRNLTRIFKKETGISVNEYITLVRKERLRELLNNPDITRKQMANHCGLKSERQVIRIMKK